VNTIEPKIRLTNVCWDTFASDVLARSFAN
jgi:hypothetical protein